jgi:hypothetical protein
MQREVETWDFRTPITRNDRPHPMFVHCPNGRPLEIHEPLATGAALGAKARPATCLAGLFVELANPHFFLDAASLYELSEAADGLLGRLLFAKRQFDQRILLLNGNGFETATRQR